MNAAPEGPAIRIAPRALSLITREAIRSRDGLETGGILLGTDGHNGIVIRHAGEPGPKARRGSHRFLRDLAHARQLAEVAWKEDRSQWIGEWHTHPSGDLAPSSYDLDSYSRHLRDPELGFDRFIAIIVGVSPTGAATPVVWIVDQKCARPTPVTLAEDYENAPSAQSPNPER
ncbi:Mov34/MPN/PAD-1 family protein [Paenarthrobacter sp. PH39-S1]|uniref:Mov34/MPN/PAD-1 family protein n=1 Tax=Paenarthrobacter sp. PH39-S1 TaxID=3046204 RepID=UPI0024B97B85|nr:Mov34/MPN/PAD-1 family protein [Paenarthrobacter sp. PH39-S1]MDJ0356626.1 Mov34/MPN/PAD-1 family protein [Paenarthrobacter sp. PH39-S1]